MLGALDEKMTKVMRIGGALENKSRELQEKLKTKWVGTSTWMKKQWRNVRRTRREMEDWLMGKWLEIEVKLNDI